MEVGARVDQNDVAVVGHPDRGAGPTIAWIAARRDGGGADVAAAAAGAVGPAGARVGVAAAARPAVRPPAGRLRGDVPGAHGRDALGALRASQRQRQVPRLHGPLRLRGHRRRSHVRLRARLSPHCPSASRIGPPYWRCCSLVCNSRFSRGNSPRRRGNPHRPTATKPDSISGKRPSWRAKAISARRSRPSIKPAPRTISGASNGCARPRTPSAIPPRTSSSAAVTS